MIGTKPAIALIPSDSNVQKAPVIHKAAFCCIFFSSDRFVQVKVSLKN